MSELFFKVMLPFDASPPLTFELFFMLMDVSANIAYPVGNSCAPVEACTV